jgi:hypothetical protein
VRGLNEVVCLLLGDVDHVVIGISVNEFIVGVNAGQGRRLVDYDYESFVSLGKLFLLEIEGLLLIFFSAEEHQSRCNRRAGPEFRRQSARLSRTVSHSTTDRKDLRELGEWSAMGFMITFAARLALRERLRQ